MKSLLNSILPAILQEVTVQFLLIAAALFFIFVAITGHIKDWFDIRNNKPGRFILGFLGILLLLIIGLSQPPSTSTTKSSDETESQPSDSFDPQWISSGENIFFKNSSNFPRKMGVRSFQEEQYRKAAKFFEEAVSDNPNDPEVRIYLNNSRARQKPSRLVLSAVVPVENSQNNAEAFLRGVADGQSSCNNRDHASYPIEIQIADDADDTQISAINAKKQANYKKVLGVIGHLSSSTTEEALLEYEEKDLPVISPTSTSDSLKNRVFFRTTPSDTVNGRELAKYAIRENGASSRAVVFYNPDDSYSESLWKAFRDEFKRLGGNAFEYTISLSDPNFNSEKALSDLRNQYDVIALFPNTNLILRAVNVAKAVKNLNSGKKPLILGGDALYDRQVLISGDSSLEGLVLAVPWYPTNQNYAMNKTKWNGELNWISAMSFDATQAFCEAIYYHKGSSPNRGDILKNLQIINLPLLKTSGTPLSFDSSGEVTRNPVLVKVAETNTAKVKGTKYSFTLIDG